MEENTKKVATVRKGGVSQNETESIQKRLTIMTGKDALYLDSNNNPIQPDSVIKGSLPNVLDGKEMYWNFGKSPDGKSYEMVSCEFGYIHDLTPEIIQSFELIGAVSQFKDLLQCD